MSVSDHVRDPKSLRGIKVTAPSAGLTRGTFVKEGDTWGIVYQDATSGNYVFMHFACDLIKLPKSTGSGNAISKGDTLYLNTTTKVVSSTQGSGDIVIGTAIEDASTSDTTVLAELRGYALS